MTWKEGYRIIDLCELARQMNCKECRSVLDLNRTMRETRVGLASVLYIVCQCGVTNQVHTSRRQAGPWMTAAYLVNIKASLSVLQHCRFMTDQLCKFFKGVGIPVTTETFSTVAQEPKPLSLSGNFTQFESVNLSQETRFRKDGPASKRNMPQDQKDVVQSDSTLYGDGDRVVVYVDTDTEVMQAVKTEVQSDNVAGVPECREVWESEAESETWEVMENCVEDDAESLEDTEPVPLKKISTETKIPAKMVSQMEGSKTEWKDTDEENSAETDCGESPSASLSASRSNVDDCKSNSKHHTQTLEGKAKENKTWEYSRDGEKIFSCQECGAVIQRESATENPLQVNSSQTLFLCTKCMTGLGKEEDLKCHVSKACENKMMFSCPECSETVTTATALKNHMRIHAGKKTFKCDVCEKLFGRKSNLKRHMLSNKHKDMACTGTSFKCPECGLTFTTATSWADHRRIHIGENPFRCEVCKKLFSGKKLLRRHIRRCHGNLAHICLDCGKAFAIAFELNRHRVIHTGQRSYTCQECKASFFYVSTLNQHMKTHIKTRTDERPFSCKVCQKSFREKCDLRKHLMTHTGERSFLCQDCGKTFGTIDILKQHYRIHSGERPYKCKCCMASFSQRGHLSTHMRIHTNETFSCEICKKVFKSLKHFTYHKELHSTERVLCQECGKTFSKVGLKVHQRIHTESSRNVDNKASKKFFCKICSAALSSYVSLWKHKRVQHGGMTRSVQNMPLNF